MTEMSKDCKKYLLTLKNSRSYAFGKHSWWSLFHLSVVFAKKLSKTCVENAIYQENMNEIPRFSKPRCN